LSQALLARPLPRSNKKAPGLWRHLVTVGWRDPDHLLVLGRLGLSVQAGLGDEAVVAVGESTLSTLCDKGMTAYPPFDDQAQFIGRHLRRQAGRQQDDRPPPGASASAGIGNGAGMNRARTIQTAPGKIGVTLINS
jgi:hypothetical protein